jgi:hypothetical protein
VEEVMSNVYPVSFVVEDRDITTFFKCEEEELDQKISNECNRLMNVYNVDTVQWKYVLNGRVMAGGRILPNLN